MSSVQGQDRKCTSVWIHCNRCFENYIDRQRIIYLLSCYDVVCEKCVTIVKKHTFKCPICKNTVKGNPVGNNLPANLKDFFHPRPWSLSFMKALPVLKFQTKQRHHFLIGCQKLKEYNKTMAKERDRLKEECKKLYFLQEEKKKEKAKLAAILRKVKELSLSRKQTNRGLERSGNSDFNFEIHQQINRRNHHVIPSTCHNMMSATRNEETFDFPPEDSLAKSFYL